MFRFAAIIVFLLTAFEASAASLRFYATPYKCYEADAVRFIYVDKADGTSIPKADIVSWSWDFNGDGLDDAAGEATADIDQTWYAAYDQSLAQSSVVTYTPSLTVTYTNHGLGTLSTITQTGVTEDVTGFDGVVDPNVLVMARALGNSEIQLTFSANPRLATNGQSVRFYADVKLLTTGTVQNVEWFFGDGTTTNGSNPQHVYWLSAGTNQIFDVAMKVTYSVLQNGTNVFRPAITNTKPAFVRVIGFTPDRAELALGRAYRRGFPQEYDWDDIIKAYSASGAAPGSGLDNYVYFHHFETAYWRLMGDLGPRGSRTPNTDQRRAIAEIINEVVQGQSLIGNQRLIEALRVKYPRLTSDAQASGQERLPTPPGVREETAAIDVALLDYQAALAYPFLAIQEFGPDILRTRATPGTEPFPDFPRYITFEDPTLSQQPVPIKNEYWQLTSTLDKMALGTMEKAKKLFRLSIQDPLARDESKEECKKAGVQGYLGMAVLAAAQTPEDFVANEGNSLLAHVKNARDLFEGINAGLNPLGNDGSFIPNESFAATYQDALEAVADAREAEINARQEDRTYDQYQAELRNELQSQRAQFITPLRNLTGIDPAFYNNLQTVDDQVDYRNTVNQRVNALLASYPNANAAGLGEYGAQVIAILDAGQAAEQAINRLRNLYEAVRISNWAHHEVEMIDRRTGIALGAIQVTKAICESFEIIAAYPPGVATKPQKIAAAAIYGLEELVKAMQRVEIADVQHEAEIRKSLLEVGNLALDIDRAKNSLDQQKLKLDSMLSLMDRYIEDLAHARDTAANLYFQDPSFRVVVSQAQRRADSELDYAIDRLYRLAKTLQYEWTEPYQNPLVIPVFCQEPPSLENPLFDKFTELDSLFIARTADESKDYLDALKAWDSKLRRINVTSVRGPNHAGPLTAEPISVREQVLGFRTTGEGAVTLDTSIRQFRDYLEQHRQTNTFNPLNPSLLLEFATGIADNSYFPATGSRWNMRISSISIDLLAETGFSTKQVAEIDLIESGMVTLRRFWADPPAADDLFNLTFNVGDPDRTAFGIVVPAKINGASGGRPATDFIAMGLADRPIAATRWILKLDTSNPSNRDLNFQKLKDIIVRFTYTYGNPPEFPNF